MKNDTQVKIDQAKHKAVAKVEKIFNALKKTSVDKIRRKLIELKYLTESDESLCNPQTDVIDHLVDPSMETIPEKNSSPAEKNSVEKGYNKVTMSASMRTTKTKMQMKNRKEKEDKAVARPKTAHKQEKPKEVDQVLKAFLESYKNEFEKRKKNYLEQKDKKEDVFREIEQLKTSKRLIESKMVKSKISSKTSLFPLNIEIELTSAIINDQKEIDKKHNSESLGLKYKVDNGKQYYDSMVVNNLTHPEWTNTFQLTLMNENELMFQLILDDKNCDTLHVLDSFDIRANEIAQNLKSTKFYKETVVTNSGNEYELQVKKKGDDKSKLKSIQKKIDAKNAIYKRLLKLHTTAKEDMENLITKKGTDLIKEWGIMSKKPKTFQESKSKIMKEEEKNSPCSLNNSPSGATHSFSKSLKTPTKKARSSAQKNSEIASPFGAPMGLNSDFSKTTKKLHKRKKSEDKKSEKNGGTQHNIVAEHSAKHIMVDLTQTKGLCSESLKKDSLKKGRAGLANSLIGFSLDDIKNVHKVKSEYNTKTMSKNSLGKIFSCLDGSSTVGGMVNQELSQKDDNDDTKSVSGLSFMSGSALFSPFGKSISGMSLNNFSLGGLH
ncbi:unnamed protein product [Moneuplotes crassus]|uniref:C2 domain-containing protein n=1 Tax=Euplotes crassus TaxID=5936 RepID=A0AAD1Y293_EUPCR|nr:unnamed protein product [Moneuplotes crassus]